MSVLTARPASALRPLAAAALALVALATTTAHAGPVRGQGTWETTLQPRDIDGDGKIDAFYDTTLNITWAAKTQGAPGKVRWSDAMIWVSGFKLKGVSGWRLPKFFDPAAACDYSEVGGTNCGYKVDPSTSEMAWMYYITLGNKGAPDAGYGLVNTGPFRDLTSFLYWTQTEYGPYKPEAWSFQWLEGRQQRHEKHWNFYAWAVHDGDVPHKNVTQP